MEAERDMYRTSNSAYGEAWQTGGCFPKSFTQSTPYKTLDNRRQVKGNLIPYDKRQVAYVHDPQHPCGMYKYLILNFNNFDDIRVFVYSNYI